MTAEKEDTRGFRGITVLENVRDDVNRVKAVNNILNDPGIMSWWTLFPHLRKEHLTAKATSISNKQFLWVARPPGIWVTIVRYENELIATNGFFPLQLEWNKVHYMLKEHGAGLICRASEAVGLVPVFMQLPNGVVTPLALGFGNVRDFNPLLEKNLAIETIAEEERDWPTGLTKPHIIGVESAVKLIDTSSREKLIREYEGVWLLSPGEAVYEVRN